ncbi:hypothetical protein BKA70DRAFT_1415831 [Coprinopsis sp. MPI-PUGE-AT-0042]|nr:hypothetical protein BKA70DRAFT_1415831 [Coprinopsis sp. MPI-PUGE-AT-0042]
MALAASTEPNVEQPRGSTLKVASVRLTNPLPRAHSTLKLSTEGGQKAMKWLKQGQIGEVSELVTDATAKGEETQILVEMLQAIYATGSEQGALLDHFFDVLDTLPNAQTATSAPFRGLLDVLRARDSENDMATVRRLGILCASKGYGDFVDSEISPLVSAGSSQLEHAQWHRTMTLALAKFKGLVLDVDQVFEESETDYQSVQAEAPSHSPPLMQTIEEALPMVLPDPSSQDGASVFEVRDDEYAVDLSRAANARDHTSSDAIQIGVRRRKFDRAYHLLEELSDIAYIEPSLVYLDAAVASAASLNTRDRAKFADAEKRLFAWLNLVATHNDDVAYYLPVMLDLLRKLETLPATHLRLLIKVSIILARKGYTRYVTNSFCRSIFIYGSPEVARAFITELEAAHHQYYQTDYKGKNHNKEHTIKGYVRGTAIRVLIQRKEFAAALDLFPDPSRDPWSLTPLVYTYLLDALQAEGHSNMIGILRRVQDHLAQFPSNHPLFAIVQPDLPASYCEPEAAREQVAEPTVSEAGLSKTLKLLKTHAYFPNTTPPPPQELREVITACRKEDKMGELTEMLNRSCTYHFSFASNLLTAEMMHYHHQSAPITLIKTFVDHFHLVGVPTLRLLDLSKEEFEPDVNSYNHQGRPTPPITARRIHASGAVQQPVKLWPSQEHVSLVWHALASIPQSNRSYQLLYYSLKDLVKSKGHDTDPNLPATGIVPLVPPPELNPMSSWAFTPFIRGLGERMTSKLAKAVIGDMILLGLQPTIVHLSELAGLYARKGNVKSAMRILLSMEQLADANKKANASGLEDIPKVVKHTVGRRNQTITGVDQLLYKAIFTGFVKSRRWLQAWKVDQKMKERYGYAVVKDDAIYRKVYGEAYYKAWSLFRDCGYPTVSARIAEGEAVKAGKKPWSLRQRPVVPTSPPWEMAKKQSEKESG